MLNIKSKLMITKQSVSLRNLNAFLYVSLIIAGLLLPLYAQAATTLTVEPITWNMVGLDSNNVNVGPNHFPVGARVCNTGGTDASDLTATFNWDTSNTYVNLRPGTSISLSVASLPVGNCTDFYFEVEITRNALAFGTKRGYHISVTADAGDTTGSTPTPREIFVKRFTSQSRNAVSDMQLSTDGSSFSSIAPGGTMSLMVGSTYWIKLVGSTATQGYEQIQTFINFPNTIFQVLDVVTTYSAESSANMDPPYKELYGDACIWEADPSSPNYQSCVSSGKAGGNITVTYKVKILSLPTAPLINPEPLNSLIYDFSGASFHYNSDYGVSARYANIINASVTKSFSPTYINPEGTSILTFTITNPGPAEISSVNFEDNLPSGMTINSTTITYSGCGTPSPSILAVGDTSLSLSGITVASLGTCTIGVSVTASTAQLYENTSDNLFIDTIDTGSYATDSLQVTNNPPGPATCTPSTTLAIWTMPTTGQGSGGPPPPYTTIASGVSTAVARAALTGAGSQAIVTGGVTTNAWRITDAWSDTNPPSIPGVGTAPYFEFEVDTSNFGGVSINLRPDLETPGQWAANNNNYIHIYSSTDGTNFTLVSSTDISKGSWQPAVSGTAATTGLNKTWFRITPQTRGNQTTASVLLDDITITGCPRPTKPTLDKAFSPTTIGQGTNSTLTFTFTNPNSTSLTGVSFSDSLPTGLVVANPNGLSGPSCTVGAISGQTITATAGSTSISMSGATLSANASCSFSVDVTGAMPGVYTNISDPISSDYTGPNTEEDGYGTSTLTVIAAPVISKSFGSTYVLTGETVSLSFAIYNPNPSITLTGVAFTDTLPAGLDVATAPSSECDGTLTVTGNAPPTEDTIVLSGGSIAAGGTCTFSVTVTGTNAGTYTNTTENVSSTNGGVGNTATASLTVRDITPALSLLKQISTFSGGPWTTYTVVEESHDVYYRFTVENIGDAALDSLYITDPMISASGCTWPSSLPVPDASDDDHIASCVVSPVIASGDQTNTATAHGTYNSTVYDSNISEATYSTTAFPTQASITYFGASVVNGEVVVEWETGSEHNTLGFYLMRYDSSSQEYISVTEGLLPGLITEPNGGVYTLIDSGAVHGGTYRYKLVEVERNGRQLVYGPFKVTATEQEAASSSKVQMNSFRIAGKESPAEKADYTRRAKLLSRGQATIVQARTVSGKSALSLKQNQAAVVKGSRIKISIEEDGLYYIDADTIALITGKRYANVKSMIRARLLAVSTQGQAVAYMPAQDNGGIYFYATGIDSAYTRNNIYWIDMGRGTSMGTEKTPVPVSANPDAVFTDTLHIEKDLIQNMAQTDNPAEDYWNWDLIFLSPYWSDGPKSFTFYLNGKADTQTQATLQVNLIGGSDTGINPDHHVVVKLNGRQIGEGWWQGLNPYTLTASFDQSLLNEGENTIVVQGLRDAGIPWSMFLIDSFALTYERLYEAEDNRLFFKGDGNQTVTVRGFNTASPDILLMNVTNPAMPKVNTSGKVTGSAGNYEISFNPSSPDARYLAIAKDSVAATANASGANTTNLKGRWNMADYLIIVPAELESAVQPLALYRKSQGMRTMVVKLDSIMNEFNFGISTPEAIKQFLSNAYKNWLRPPKYIVLAGVGTWDYKDNLGEGGNLIPPALVPTLYGLSTSDNYFADVDGDHLPDMAIGRLPAVNAQEMQTLITKIKTFEATKGSRAILVADDPDEGGNFPVDSQIIASLFPAHYVLQKVYLGEYSSVNAARVPLLSYLNTGSVFFNYIGHASFDTFTAEELLISDDMASLTNASNLPIVTAITCLAGEFAIPGYPTISQVALLNPAGGAAAFWSATGLSDNAEAHILNREFYNAVFFSGKRVLGDAVMQALQQYRMTGSMPFMMDIYTILGDPALRIK